MRTNRSPARIILLMTVVLGCGGERSDSAVKSADGDERAGGVAVFCALNTPDALNPFASPDEAATDLVPALYTPLVLYDSVGGFKPHLARSWTWSPDSRTLQFMLRNDVRWHDGKPVTPGDVVWTIKAAADSAYPYAGRAEFADIVSVSAADSIVELRFAKPFAAGLEPFSRLPILPQHLLDSVPAARFAQSSYHREPIGSGPFRYAGRLPDGSVKLDRFADYPEELGRAHLNRIVLREVPEPPAILVELQSGSADVCTVGSSIAADAEKAGSQILPVAPVGTLIMAVDHRKAPFTDVRLRQAISAALNRAEIASVISQAAVPARTFLPAEARRWTDSRLLQPDHDLAAANALLDSAGWRTGAADGIRRNASGSRLRFTLTAPAPLQRVLPVIQAHLRQAGIDVQLRLMEGSAFFGLLGDPARRPEAVAVIFNPDRIAVPNAYELLHSSGSMNISSYQRAAADSVLDRLQNAVPDEERGRLYHAMQQYVATDIPVIYVVHTPRMLAVKSRMRDVRVDVNGPFGHAAQWWIPAGERNR
jgi:peptide/nickel transport system substrate-binding protein